MQFARTHTPPWYVRTTLPIALLAISLPAHAGDAFQQQTTFECTSNTWVYAIHPDRPDPEPNGSYNSCDEGFVFPGNTAHIVPVDVVGQQAWTSDGLAALDEAARQWSNTAGSTSAIAGALDWSFTTGPLETKAFEDTLCNGVNEVFYASSAAVMQPVCGSETAAACVLPQVGSGGTCDVQSFDIILNPEVSWNEVDLPSYIDGPVASLRQVLMHELGHGIGISHDNRLPSKASLVSLMDRHYPNGGDFGGDQGNNPTQDSLRIGTYEYLALGNEKGFLNTGYSNPMLKKFKQGTNKPQKAVEVWTEDHHTKYGADWSHQPGWGFAWENIEFPKGIYPVLASVNSESALTTAKVEWYLWNESGDCGEDSGVKIGEEDVNNGSPMQPGVDYEVGLHSGFDNPPMEVPCAYDPDVTVNQWYKVCAKLVVLGGPNASTDDDTVFSEQLFELQGGVNDDTGCYCEPPAGQDDCPNGTTCTAKVDQLDECLAP